MDSGLSDKKKSGTEGGEVEEEEVESTVSKKTTISFGETVVFSEEKKKGPSISFGETVEINHEKQKGSSISFAEDTEGGDRVDHGIELQEPISTYASQKGVGWATMTTDESDRDRTESNISNLSMGSGSGEEEALSADSGSSYSDDPHQRYFETARIRNADTAFSDRKRADMPSRGPYRKGVTFCHGAHYFEDFKKFLADGGLGHHKNAVVMNIRVNNIFDLDVMEGSCKLNFFLDLAFWVPIFDEGHYMDESTMGMFALYEPIVDFPDHSETDFVRRNVEFSKHPGARRHEVQLGQNFETQLSDVVLFPSSPKLAPTSAGGDGYEAKDRTVGRRHSKAQQWDQRLNSITTNPVAGLRSSQVLQRFGSKRRGAGGDGGGGKSPGLGKVFDKAAKTTTSTRMSMAQNRKQPSFNQLERQKGTALGPLQAGGVYGGAHDANGVSESTNSSSSSSSSSGGGGDDDAAQKRESKFALAGHTIATVIHERHENVAGGGNVDDGRERDDSAHEGPQDPDAKHTEGAREGILRTSKDVWKKSIKKAKRGDRPSLGPQATNMRNLVSSSAGVGGFFADVVEGAMEAQNKRASDRHAHWPRLWRTFISEDELEEFNNMSKEERKQVEPTNNKPENGLTADMRALFLRLDSQREELDLAHPSEGIVFSTYEIEARTRQTYELFDFPFDMQEVEIVVRLDSHRGDPLKRHIIPLCHDKAFFCSSRVPPLTEWRVTRNLEWHVERGARGNEKMDGGKERLVASIIALRRSYYYTRHYILILFLMTSSSFTCFTVNADDVETRSNIVFSLLLTIVAFNYSCSESIPKVPYATILEVFINLCFLAIMAVGFFTFTFSFLRHNNEELYEGWYETIVGWLSFFVWFFGNGIYWHTIFARKERIKEIIDKDEQLGWLSYNIGKKKDLNFERVHNKTTKSKTLKLKQNSEKSDSKSNDKNQSPGEDPRLARSFTLT